MISRHFYSSVVTDCGAGGFELFCQVPGWPLWKRVRMMRLHNEALTHTEEHGMVRHEADTTVGRVLQGALGNENVLGTLGMVPNCGVQIKDGPHEVSSSWDVIAWTIKGHPNQV